MRGSEASRTGLGGFSGAQEATKRPFSVEGLGFSRQLVFRMSDVPLTRTSDWSMHTHNIQKYSERVMVCSPECVTCGPKSSNFGGSYGFPIFSFSIYPESPILLIEAPTKAELLARRSTESASRRLARCRLKDLRALHFLLVF